MCANSAVHHLGHVVIDRNAGDLIGFLARELGKRWVMKLMLSRTAYEPANTVSNRRRARVPLAVRRIR